MLCSSKWDMKFQENQRKIRSILFGVQESIITGVKERDMKQIIDKIELGGYSYAVGCYGVTEIKVRWENGEMAGVRWFEIWHGKRHLTDINGKYVISISYRNSNDKF